MCQLFRDTSTSLVISRLGSLGVYQKAVYFYCCVVNVSFCSLILILWYMNLMNNGQMDRGNENPTQHLPWWLRKTTKNPQSGWSAPGFKPGTSRMRVSCVTTEPPRSVYIVFLELQTTFRFKESITIVDHYRYKMAAAFFLHWNAVSLIIYTNMEISRWFFLLLFLND